MSEQSVQEIVKNWLDGEHTMFDAVQDAPEQAWLAILQISARGLNEEQLSLLAGGPLESLLAWHGSQFIDRVENEAANNPKFNHLLGGVWQNLMPQEIWERVLKARKEVW
jgi:hypothetical protein